MGAGTDYELVEKTQQLPQPRRGRAGSLKIWLLALVSICILACAGFWLTRPASEKKALRYEAANYARNLLADTPFAWLAELLRPAPAPLPEPVLHPATESGTLAGPAVTGTIAAPLDFGDGPNPSLPESSGSANSTRVGPLSLPGLLFPGQQERQVVFDQEPVAPVSEDSRIRPGYLTALAQWLVNRYRPGPQGGTLAASAQALNQEGAATLASQTQGGRSGLLRYAFHPSMISGLYRLYIDRFMADLNEAAIRKGLNASQNRQFHRALAGRAALLASSLGGVLAVPDLTARLAQIDALAQKSVDANADLATAVFELDEARSSKAGQQVTGTAQMRVDRATALYRRASDDYIQAQGALAAEIRRYSGQNADEETLLFLAAWVARRYAQGGQAKGAIESCISALRDLANRCARFEGGG